MTSEYASESERVSIQHNICRFMALSLDAVSKTPLLVCVVYPHEVVPHIVLVVEEIRFVDVTNSPKMRDIFLIPSCCCYVNVKPKGQLDYFVICPIAVKFTFHCLLRTRSGGK